MSEKPRVIFEDKEREPQRMLFEDLVPGKTYIVAEEIRIFMGEQDSVKRSGSRDVASLKIPPGLEFLIHQKSSSINKDKKIIFSNGLEFMLADGCFPTETVLVIEKNEHVEGFN